jgi:hypothetical protein
MAESYANYVATTINDVGGIDNSITTFVITDGTGFPTANFRILVENEIMFVGTRSGTTLSSITRGAESTSAVAHADGVEVHHVLTAGAIDQVRADIALTGAFSALPAASKEGILYLPTDGPYIARDTGAAWEYWLPGIGKVTPPPSAGWSWDNQAGSSIVSSAGVEYLTALDQGANEVCIRYRTAPTPPYTLDITLKHDITSVPPGTTPTGNRFGYVVGWRESDTGKMVLLRFGRSLSAWVIAFDKWTDNSTLTASYTTFTTGQVGLIVQRSPQHIRIEDDATNVKVYWSIDNINWEQFESRLKGDFLASAGPDQVCFGGNSYEQDIRLSILGWTEG